MYVGIFRITLQIFDSQIFEGMKTRVLPVPGGFVGPEVSKVVGTEGCMVGNFVGHRVGDNATNKDL